MEQSLRHLTNQGTEINAERMKALGEIRTLRAEAKKLVPFGGPVEGTPLAAPNDTPNLDS